MSVDSLEDSSSYQIDEPEDLELTEIDGALLRDLLEEEEEEEDEDEDEDEGPYSLEVLKMTTTDEQELFSLEDSTMEEESLFDMMEMMNPTLPSNEAMAYMYIDEMVEMIESAFVGGGGDSTEFCSGVSADSNTSYCCLWQY